MHTQGDTYQHNNSVVDTALEEWKREREFLSKEREIHGELFKQAPCVDDEDTLRSIGIENIFGSRPLGHLKLFPEDFIVEEVSSDGKTHTIDFDRNMNASETVSGVCDVRTTWARTVKMGIDTIEVAHQIARMLNIDRKRIGFAGIKDKYALTSQLISIRGVTPDDVRKISSAGFFLKDIVAGKGTLQTGDLLGNRFTIVVRTGKPLRDEDVYSALHDLEEQGFWNFFYIQRFGTPRLISHKLGLLILQGKFEEAVQVSLGYGSGRENLFFKNFRRDLLKYWGNWGAMLKEIEPLSYSLRSEKKMLLYLYQRPSDFSGALNQIPDQVRLWVYAYGSYLFNKTLSRLIQSGSDVPFELPLALSGSLRAQEFYGDFFKAHHIMPPFHTLKEFPYVQKAEKDVHTLKKFTLYNYKIIDEGVVIDFFLDKAAYATTLLSHIFMLSSGQPLPDSISIKEIDSKCVLGTGTIQPIKENKFRTLFDLRKEMDIFKNEVSEV